MGALVASVAAFSLAASVSASAQPDGSQTSSSSSTTLDQIMVSASPVSVSPKSASDLEVPQLPGPSRAASATSSEVANRGESRQLATEPVGGADACDQRTTRRKLCEQKLEARAEQYSRPGSALVTPEGRLLLLVSPGTGVGGLFADTRKLTSPPSGLNDPNGPAAQIAGALQEQATIESVAANPVAVTNGATATPGTATTILAPPTK